MKKSKLVVALFAALLSMTGLLAHTHGASCSHAHSSTLQKECVDELDLSTLNLQAEQHTESLSCLVKHDNCEEESTHSSKMLTLAGLNDLTMARESTTVANEAGLVGFFTSALKSVAVWGGVKLTKYVLSKIQKRAKTYDYYYNAGNHGVVKAAQHWNDLMIRSQGRCGEPDHNVHKAGFQGAEDCPICSKQISDLKSI